MAHRALALKYRPQVFADMIGQEHVSGVLARALETKRVAHAYLFTGVRGVGKTTCARILAKAINCETRATALAAGKDPGADPCNKCTSCTEITNGVSLDVTEIDGASNRGIEDVRNLRENVRFTPTGGRFRVVIIDEVHQLSNDAFAALLKTLEEPPPHLVFIFATTDPQKVPETIRSRTQRFDFARVPIRKVADRLLDIAKREAADKKEGLRFKLTEGAALLMAHKSEGSMRDAVSALDQVVSSGETEVDEALVRRVLGIADREVFFDLAAAITGRDPQAALRALHQAFDKGLDARDIAEGLAEHIRHILILKVDPKAGDLVALSREDLARLVEQGRDWTESDLLRLLRLASEAHLPMRDSPHPLIHLEVAVMQMATLEPGETLARILERLEALERRLGGGTPAPAGAAGRSAGGAAGGRSRGPAASATPVRSGAPARAVPPGSSAGGGARPGAAGAPRPIAGPPSPPAAPRASALPTAARPTPAVAVADEPITADAGTRRRWSETLAAINGRKRMLGAFLEESRFVGLAGTDACIATDDLHRAVIEESGNRALIAEELTRAFGAGTGFRCVPPDFAGPAEDTPRDETPRPDVNEMIRRAIAFFEGDEIGPNSAADERTDG